MARQGGRFPKRKPAPVPMTGTFEDSVARLRAASSNRMANSDEFRDVIGLEAEPRMMSANPQVTNSTLQATIAPQTPLNRFEPYLSQLEAGPATVGMNIEASTVLRPTIGPATPRDKFEPLLNEVARLNTARREAGVTNRLLDPVEGMQQRQLAGGVPAAVQNPVEGGFDRVHMDYERGAQGQAQYNPITSKLEAVPYLDPVTGKAMVTELGNVGKTLPDGHDKASEYLAQQVLRLAGRKAVANNKQITDTGDVAFWRTDLKDIATGEQIDAEVRWNAAERAKKDFANTLSAQVYTAVDMNPGGVAGEKFTIKDAISDVMRRKNVNIGTAVETLIQNKKLRPADLENPTRRAGKVLKNNADIFNREDQFDSLFMPGYHVDDAKAMETGDKYNRNYNVIAPTSMHMVDLNNVRQYIRENKGGLSKGVQVNENYGDGGERGLRYQVKQDMPITAVTSDGKAVAQDLVQIHPLIQQLLANQGIIS